MLIVEDPGELNDGPGPDFLGARIWLDDWQAVGEVECHVEARDWWRHGHAHDPAYQRVVLHVVQQRDMGPPLPTLVVPTPLTIPGCLAQRSPSPAEILRMAALRLQAKVQRWRRIKQTAPEAWPQLGLCEVMAYGPQRRAVLHWLAMRLGWSAWPGVEPWQGSRLSQVVVSQLPPRFSWALKQGFINTQLFQDCPPFCSTYKKLRAALISAGLPATLAAEWIVNVAIPGRAPSLEEGLSWWSAWVPPRPYGVVQRLARSLGLKLSTVLEQQALLGWYLTFCRSKACFRCPVIKV